MSVSTSPIVLSQSKVKSSCLTKIASVSPNGNITVWLSQKQVDVLYCARGLPELQVEDWVIIDETEEGSVIIRDVIDNIHGRRGGVMEYTEEEGHAQVSMPKHVDRLTVALGDARIELNRNGNLRLNGKNILSESSGLHQLSGQPVSLN
ncbi:hypothetical protein [Marinomonas mediterranea]|jgi:hypothetical protein|uniref:Uncharacterized protein n=1 Tax=Marinomonas mediterranea (strain ATCC 700492 / JCM 21426 / NBRC 103028 / MMB-1) TaxID=717774 RepID=F2K298_MARM1|nr:hypothetical protein [Marinomonas mediterranea]ADZ92278.1 hypothetical protein Marme_3059 [Marinomonas mediterranea MMB-1]WCN10229.1 hypothetical protein GV055_15590 [Marinomonas mediterranea]WCN14277.1 hypothetical protein GV054_15405 [Marinomonas mediterranea]WCN18329.1 hypothetical protein GV053_15470 [Marinomonas mediterranea MMB-1]